MAAIAVWDFHDKLILVIPSWWLCVAWAV